MQPQCRPLRHPKYPKSKTLVTNLLHDLTSKSESKDGSCIQVSGLPGMKLYGIIHRIFEEITGNSEYGQGMPRVQS